MFVAVLFYAYALKIKACLNKEYTRLGSLTRFISRVMKWGVLFEICTCFPLGSKPQPQPSLHGAEWLVN